MLDITDILKRAARGGGNYHASRIKIARSLISDRHEEIGLLSPFLTRELFRLPENSWIALAFNRHDWGVLDALRRSRRDDLDKYYLYFLISYIAANAARVTSLYDCNMRVSGAVVDDDGARITAEMNELNFDDHQSLFSFRVACAQYSRSTDELHKHFNRSLKTDWLRKRFLFPLVHHAINAPADDYFDSFLSYVITGREEGSERATIRFLLRDDVCHNERLAFKAYVALLCHPYDACEILINHIETEFARTGDLDETCAAALQAVDKVISAPRISSLVALVAGKTPASARPSGVAMRKRYDFPQHIANFVTSFADASAMSVPSADLSKPLLALLRMRTQRYPTQDDFDYLIPSAQKWRFTEAGRLLNSMITSLYMVPRTESTNEIRDLNRLVMFLGEVCPFVVASPSGAQLLNRAGLGASDHGVLEELCDLHIKPSEEYNDRMWIKAVQWSLRDSQRRGRIADWLAAIRRNIRVAPAYLSGVDWAWVDSVIKQARIAPFAGTPQGIYALLLMHIEQPGGDPTVLRTAIEPLIRGMSAQEVVAWLISEFNTEATAFVRYFLTPENLILLRLAPNVTAALTARVSALETCIRAFGFTDLLSHDLYEQESKALTTSLLLLNIHAGQFEIPWAIFRRDVTATRKDMYDTITSLAASSEGDSLLSSGRIETPHRYRNGKIVSYSLQNVDWPIGSLIISIIEDFLQHPSFGLEVLLSTRFRHDTLRREIVRVVNDTAGLFIAGVGNANQRAIIDRLSVTLASDTDHWLDRRIHSQRPGRPDGLFDMTPTQDDFIGLVDQMRPLQTFAEMIDCVSGWLRRRLDDRLAIARDVFRTEFGDVLHSSVVRRRADLQDEFRGVDVTKVSTALSDALARRVNDLVDWFKGPVEEERQPLTFAEIKQAADGLFETAISQNVFRAFVPNTSDITRKIAPDRVRLCFDVIHELYVNASKHSPGSGTRVRIREFKNGHHAGYVFSNVAVPTTSVGITRITGKQFHSDTEAIFREATPACRRSPRFRLR